MGIIRKTLIEILALRAEVQWRRVHITSGCATRDCLYVAVMPRLVFRVVARDYVAVNVVSIGMALNSFSERIFEKAKAQPMSTRDAHNCNFL